MIPSDSLHIRASTSPLLPPEVVVQTGWFGRARNFSIFSLAWYRYRSTAFLIGTLLVALLLTALAAVPAQPVDLDWGDVLQVGAVYCVPVVLLILLGPGWAVWVRKRAWAGRVELLIMFMVLLSGIAVSLATFFQLKTLYEAVRVDQTSGGRSWKTLPRAQVFVNRQRGLSAGGPPYTLLTDESKPMLAMVAAIEEMARTAPRKIDPPDDADRPPHMSEILTPTERAAMNDYFKLHASGMLPTPVQEKAIGNGLQAIEKWQRASNDYASKPHKPVRTEPESAEYKAALAKFLLAQKEVTQNMLRRAPPQLPPQAAAQPGARSVAADAGTVTLALAIVLLLSWLGGLTDLVAFSRQRGKLDDALQAQALRRADAARVEAELRLSVLAAQVEPHFLFNTLASLRSAIVSDQARAANILDHLVDYLRSTIPQMRSDAASPSVSLATQLNAARAYLALMRERMPRLSFSVDAESGLDEAQVPPLMLISLVENAVKHGVEPKPGAARIAVMARRITVSETDVLELSVSDDGVGFGNATGGSGIGLANIQERLGNLNRQQAKLVLQALPDGGVAAILHLPLRFPPET